MEIQLVNIDWAGNYGIDKKGYLFLEVIQDSFPIHFADYPVEVQAILYLLLILLGNKTRMINKIKVESHLKSSDHNVIRTSNALEVINVKGNISKSLDFKI